MTQNSAQLLRDLKTNMQILTEILLVKKTPWIFHLTLKEKGGNSIKEKKLVIDIFDTSEF